MIQFFSAGVLPRPANVPQALVPPQAHPAPGVGVSGLCDLPPELWLLAGSYLPVGDQAEFFNAHPQEALAGEARWATMAATIRKTRDAAVVSGVLAQAQDLPPRRRARLLTQVVRWACAQLNSGACGPCELPLQALLEACLDQADSLPPAFRNRVLAALLMRLPHPYCDRQDFVHGRHGVFATRLLTGVLAAARDGDEFVCRAVAASERGLARVIDLEYGLSPGLKHEHERAARAAEFMQVLGQAETVARGDVGAALACASSLVSYFLSDQMETHLPLLRRLVQTPGKTSKHLGLYYLAEIVERVADPAARADLMCEMVASAKASAEKEMPTAVQDAVDTMARLLRRPSEALGPVLRASVNAALKAAGYRGAPL